ncbi:MAG: hypothetical protein JHC22_01080 [Thermoproteus sp.]|nr:hypothetical protein [Thermoproteus sp.]
MVVIVAVLLILMPVHFVVESPPYHVTGSQPPQPPPAGQEEAATGVFFALLAVVFALAIALIAVFFLYIFRGYRALHRLGFKWAWWLAWGPIVEIVLVLVAVPIAIISIPSAVYHDMGYPAEYPAWLGIITAAAPLLALFVISVIIGLIIDIAHIIFLYDMHKYTKIGYFQISFILYIIGLVLSLIIFSVAAGVLATLVLFAEYITEMLAYREASRWTPPVAPSQ